MTAPSKTSTFETISIKVCSLVKVCFLVRGRDVFFIKVRFLGEGSGRFFIQVCFLVRGRDAFS